MELIIKNGRIVTPTHVVEGDLIIKNGKIAHVNSTPCEQLPEHVQVIDAKGMYVMPGMIDTHSDAIEKEIQPRPGTLIPVDMAVVELEKKLAASGITTIYHSICSSDGTPVRNDQMVKNIIDHLTDKRVMRSMIHHRVHYRYEITNIEGTEMIESLIHNKKIDLLSFMDHTPGQGQFQDASIYKDYLVKTENISDQEAEKLLVDLKKYRNLVDWNKLKRLADAAFEKGIRIASHDDDTKDKVNVMKDLHVSISEFPINLETAKYAADNDLFISVGAPNIVRGGSHSKNMKAMDAVLAGTAKMICSDYYPQALLPAVFKVVKEGVDLTEAVNLVTLYAAKALGLDGYTGSIEAGKQADLILVEMDNGYPIVRKTLVEGTIVYQSNYFQVKEKRNPSSFMEEVK